MAGTAIVPFHVAVSTPNYLLKAVKTHRVVISNSCEFTTLLLKQKWCIVARISSVHFHLILCRRLNHVVVHMLTLQWVAGNSNKSEG